MAKSNNAFLKKQKEQVKRKKKQDKEEKKADRKKTSSSDNMESMMAYVDEFGNISSTPPEKKIAPPEDKK